MRPWIVWSTGLLAYIVAVLDRTTLGVSGLDAAKRFAVSPGVLSTFVVLQVCVYAGMQIPAGLLVDRFGSKVMIIAGGSLLAAGQLTLAFTESLPAAIAGRAVVGLGDAFTFISVLRLVPHWFSQRQTPLVAQLTCICGQLGQVLSAVPFLALLISSGWSTAYTSVVALGVLSLVLTLLLVKDFPGGSSVKDPQRALRETLGSVKTVWLRPGTRLGFFATMGTQFSHTVFTIIWGFPYLTAAQHLSRAAAGTLLTISVVVAIVFGVFFGVLGGRHPHRRSWLVLGVIASNTLVWTVVLALPFPAPLWLLVMLIVVISTGTPGSTVGLDFACTFNTKATLGTAQGAVNMGGHLASVVVMPAMGLIIGDDGSYSFDSFRLAWCVQYVIWVVTVVGIFSTRKKARRTLGEIEESRYLLEYFPHFAPSRRLPDQV